MSRCVFVGNIPYDTTEEQLVQICEEVGPVVSFRLVMDRETGKPKGYGFCEFRDEETALSARRNLSGYEIGGRHLRVDFAENEKLGLPPAAPSATVPTPAATSMDQGQGIGLAVAASASAVMAGALGSQPGAAPDALTKHLASMPKQQLYDVMCQMNALVHSDQQAARHLLASNPQLSKALFQVQIMLGMVHLPPVVRSYGMPCVDVVSPQGQMPVPPQNKAFQATQPPPFVQPQQPQFGMSAPFPTQTQRALPLQPPLPPPPQVQASRGMPAVYGMPVQPQQQMSLEMGQQQQQQYMLQQVMSLTPEQISGLAPETRQQVLELQQRFGSSRQ